MNHTPLRILLKTIYTAAVFAAAFLITSRVMNKPQPDLVLASSQATLPVVTMRQENIASFNTLFGYTREMDVSRMRGTLYVTGPERTCDAHITSFGAGIADIAFEIRTLDGENLIEQTQIKDPVTTQDGMDVSFAVKDLIEYDTEYMLVLLLRMHDGKIVRYYTRFISTTDEELMRIGQHIRFAHEVHEGAINASPDVKRYLETTQEAGEASFQDVDIHAPFGLFTWEGLVIADKSEPEVDVYDIHADTASVSLRYQVTLLEEEREKRYNVTENFFTRCTERGNYLIDYHRSMRYVFAGEKEDVSGKTLDLSYTTPDPHIRESASGSAVAFVNEGRLFVYQLTDNRMTQVFGFYEEDADVRTTRQVADIRILRIDEGGNALFDVTGYMCRGKHEGEVGTAVYDYNASDNTITELIWLPETASEEILIQTNSSLRYINYMGVYYCLRGDDLYAINLYDGTTRSVARDLVTSGYSLSFIGNLVAWQDTPLSDTIHVLDMGSEEQTDVSVAPGDALRLLGFIDGDLIYGRVDPSQVRYDKMGNPVYPMHEVHIRNMDGVILTTYENEQLPVTDVTVENNRVVLHRVTLGGTDAFSPAQDDQIVRTSQGREPFNYAERVNLENGYTVRLVLRDEVDGEKRKLFITQETVYETILPDAPAETRGARYITYHHRSVEGVYLSPSQAVRQAYALCGQVTDETGRYVYYRGNSTARNQIMSLTQAVEDRDFSGQGTLAACLKAMLEYEGAGGSVDDRLSQGVPASEILAAALPNARVLALDGCPLSAMLFYVDLVNDIPVLAQISPGTYVLLIGYNETEVVLFDPSRGTETVYKVTTDEAEAMFEENGNRFVTYIR